MDPSLDKNPIADDTLPRLSWNGRDIECMLGLKGRRFTQVHGTAGFVFGILLSLAFFGVVSLANGTVFQKMFFERGIIPWVIVIASCWCFAILLIKRSKLRLQRKALRYKVVPDDPEYVISSATAQRVLVEVYRDSDDPRQFMLFNRIVTALSNLKNLGRVTDVDEILRSQADQDEAIVETSYGIVRGLIWMIPTLGFIGTVLGLSDAIGGFGAVLGSAENLDSLTDSLRTVTSGLSTAFDTTLEALVAAVFLHGYYTILYKSELEFLDDCADYCHRNIVNRLRVTPFETQES